MNNSIKSAAGYSLVELLVVLVIIAVMSAVAGFYLTAHQELYKAEEQALQIIDLLQEARQRSLTQRRTQRVEIDLTANMVRLINENDGATANDDVLTRQITLMPPDVIKLENSPSEINVSPPESLPVPDADFKQSNYPSSQNNNVCTLRFQSDGMVSDAGTNAVGRNASIVGNTIYVWSPDKINPNQSEIALAITVVGSTGSIRLWEYVRASSDANKWKDSRRTSGYSR